MLLGKLDDDLIDRHDDLLIAVDNCAKLKTKYSPEHRTQSDRDSNVNFFFVWGWRANQPKKKNNLGWTERSRPRS